MSRMAMEAAAAATTSEWRREKTTFDGQEEGGTNIFSCITTGKVI